MAYKMTKKESGIFGKVFLLVSVFAVFISVCSFALEEKPQEELRAIVVVSDSADFVKEWFASNYHYAPRVDSIREAQRNRAFHVAVIVSGYGIDDSGKVDLSGTCSLIGPDGKALFEDVGALKIKSDKGVLPGSFLMFEETFDITLEDADPLGDYLVKAVIEDKVLGKTVSCEHKFSLKEESIKALPGGFNSDESFGKWMTYYYLQPEPERITAAIKYYSDGALYAKQSSRLPVASFFAALFRKEPALMQKSFDDLSLGATDKSKILFLRSLWLTDTRESRALIDKAGLSWDSDEVKRQVQDIKGAVPLDILKAPVSDAAHLDMLWASFMATGDILPIKRIISALHLLKDGHGILIAVGGAAQWSLQSNALMHKKVFDICRKELENVDPVTKGMLQEIVDKVDGKKAAPYAQRP